MKYTNAQICAQFNISPWLLQMMRKVDRKGLPELVVEVRDGRMSVNLALQICAFDHDGQRVILQQIGGMAPRERTGFVRRLTKLCREAA